MAHRVCPCWVGYLLLSPLRRLVHNPRRMLGPFVRPGMTVLDIGCAMGFFTLPLAEMIGPGGKVVAVDVQPSMLAAVRRRAGRAGLAERITPHLAGESGLALAELAGKVDFALAFAVLHEVNDLPALLRDLAGLLRPDGVCLVAEPKAHVLENDFQATLAAAREASLDTRPGPQIRGCHSAIFARG
jgi:ubiquinone/menaquinone biosynthesis C-methylase UbiE